MAGSDAAAPPGRVAHLLHGLAMLFVLPALVLAHAWATLAIWFAPRPSEAWLRGSLALAFALVGGWALFRSSRRPARVAYAAVFAAILAGWILLVQPLDRRDWREEVAVLPRATVNGDLVTITGVRNFEFRSRDDFTPRYETRHLRISHITGVDFYVSFWMKGPIGHTFLSFTFDDAPPLSISIETRPEKGQGFDPLASLFRRFQLIYVVGEERDLVRLRTNYRDEDVFLYRLNVPPQAAQALFREYVRRINELADRPEFYNLLSNSCTVNIVRYANLAGRQGGWSIRHYFNGWIDRYFYDEGYLDSDLPFAELRRRSDITAVSKAAGDGPDYPQKIRANLPTIRRPAPG